MLFESKKRIILSEKLAFLNHIYNVKPNLH